MIPEQILISLVYDTGTGIVSRLRDSRACQQAVERAAESTAAEIDGVTKGDLLNIFRAELDGDALSVSNVSSTRSDLEHALKVRANTSRDISYESVLDHFLQSVEENLVETGQPEVISRILYEYTKETNALAEAIATELQRRHERYHQDLEALGRWSNRLAPDQSSYPLPGTETHISLSGANIVDSAVDDGKSVIVTGPAGVGKSGVLAKRYHENTGKNPVYFLDAREFDQINSIDALEGELGIQTSFREVFDKLVAQYDQCTLLVDQLDNVRTEPVATTFQNLLPELAKIDGLTIICACRHWDLNKTVYEQIAKEDAFQKIVLEPLEESQVRSHLMDLGVGSAGQTKDIVELCQSLLNLSLLADVCASEKSLDTKELSSQVELWDAYRESLDEEGSRTGGAIPSTWDESPVQRAVSHARSSLRNGTTTFTVKERDPGDQRLISRGTILEDWKRRYYFQHDELQSYFYAWEANERGWSVEKVLADGIDEHVAADIFDWLLQFYSDDPAKCTSFVRDGLGSSSPLGFYSRSILATSARDLGPNNLPEETVSAVIDAVQADEDLAREFYRDLLSPDWAHYLISTGRLVDSGQCTAGYISALADEHPNLLLQALNTDETPAESRLRAYLSASESLDEQSLAIFTDSLVNQLTAIDPDTIQRLEWDLCGLIGELVAADCANAARDLTSVLTEPTDVETNERDIAGQTIADVAIGYRVRPQTLQSLFDEQGKSLIETCGESLLAVLENHVRTCLDHLASGSLNDVSLKLTMGRRSELSRINPSQLEVVLLRALESSLKHLLATDSVTAHEYLRRYRSEGGVFRQTALAVLASEPDHTKDQIREVLTEPSNVDDGTISTEFITLLDKGFSLLSPDEQRTLLDRILDRPDEEAIREQVSDDPQIESDSELDRVVRDRVERWQLRRLYQVRDDVKEDYRTKIEQLIERHGEIEYSPGSGYHVPFSMGDEPDESTLDVSSLDSEAFITACLKYARPYQADDEEVMSETGPRERLKQALSSRIHENPDVYLSCFPKLVETGDEAFVEESSEALQFLIEGVENKDTTVNEWQSVVEGIVAFFDYDSPDTWPRDCRQNIAELLLRIIGHKRSTFPVVEYQSDLATVLTALLNDPDPQGPVDNWNTPMSTGREIYVSGVRATGVTVTLHFLRVLNRELDETNNPILWESLEELRSDSVRPVRFALGKQLPLLFALNESFVKSQLDILFPEGENQEALSRFTAA